MKKIFVFACLVVASVSVKAQQQVSVGVEIGLPFADLSTGNGFGVGFSGKYHYTLTENLQLTGTTGYMSFAGKSGTGTNAFGIVPLKAGVRFSIAENLFIEPEMGLWFGNNGWGSSFAYGAGITKGFGKFEFGGRIEGSSNRGANAWFIGLRGAYKFDLK